MIKYDSNDIQKLYIAYFGRPGDPKGISYWMSSSITLLKLRDISNELSRQEEYKYCIGEDKSFEFKVNRLYLNLFNRKADCESLN